jgi:ribosomal protein S18 acetylase RimI-like enzyme
VTTGKRADEQTGKGFVIESVTDFDEAWPELEALVLGIVDYHRPWEAKTLRPKWAPIMREYMENHCINLIARSDAGEALGFLSGTIRSDFGIFEGTIGHVDNAFVVESARGDGIGRQLYQHFEAMCSEQGVVEIRLDVAEGNHLGERFWQGSGFKTQMLVMSKTLEAAQ